MGSGSPGEPACRRDGEAYCWRHQIRFRTRSPCGASPDAHRQRSDLLTPHSNRARRRTLFVGSQVRRAGTRSSEHTPGPTLPVRTRSAHSPAGMSYGVDCAGHRPAWRTARLALSPVRAGLPERWVRR
jgi:hypothetical protein